MPGDQAGRGSEQPLLWADATPRPPSHRSVAPLTEDSVVRPRDPVAAKGWRGLLERVRGGRGNERDRAWADRLERCRRPVPGGRRVAVVSRKGGVGKTTTTLMIGHTLAAVRDDRVLAIDGNADAGTLGHRVPRDNDQTVMDALDALEDLRGYPDLRRYTSQAPSRLEVLASPEDPHASRALAGQDYQRLMDAVHPHYPILLCDTGTGILDGATQGILDSVDQVVLVCGPALDAARAAAATLDWLDANGRAGLVNQAVVVINQLAPAGRVDGDQIRAHFAHRCRAVVVVPRDRHLRAGGRTDPDQLVPAAQEAWLEVAAAVADGFALPSPRDLRMTP